MIYITGLEFAYLSVTYFRVSPMQRTENKPSITRRTPLDRNSILGRAVAPCLIRGGLRGGANKRHEWARVAQRSES